MPRIRSIKPDYWEDEVIAALSHSARLLYIGLWNFADDEGRMRGQAAYIRSKVFPYESNLDVQPLLKELTAAGRIVRYKSDGQEYIFLPHFNKHQKIDRPQQSNLPAPPEDVCASIRRTFDESSTNARDGVEWNGMDKNTARATDSQPSVNGQQPQSAAPVWMRPLIAKGYTAEEIAQARASVLSRPNPPDTVTNWTKYLEPVLDGLRNTSPPKERPVRYIEIPKAKKL